MVGHFDRVITPVSMVLEVEVAIHLSTTPTPFSTVQVQID